MMRLFILEQQQTDEEQVLLALKNIISGTKYEDKVFLAGGAVRDELMGKKSKDLDFLVLGNINAGIDFAEYLAKRLGVKKENNPITYPKYGTAALRLDGNNMGIPSIELEFVAPRKEEYSDDSRKPIVTQGGLEDDALRRDFTINSLLKNISTGEIVDVTGRGIDDIKKGIIRATSNPDEIFSQDPLRMMRFIRFLVKYNMEADEKTLNAVKKNADRINIISKERIRDEFNKIIVFDVARGLNLMKETGLLNHIIPELAANIGVTQNEYHKDDVFDHIVEVAKNSPPNLKVRLMAIFHDIGKYITKQVDDANQKVTFYGHEIEGERIVRDVMKNLRYPTELIDSVAKGVRQHMRTKQAGDNVPSDKFSDQAIRKLIRELGGDLEDILELIHADNISHSEHASMPNQVKNLRKRIQDVLAADAKANVSGKLPINGNDIMNVLKIKKAGREMRTYVQLVQDAYDENPNLTKEDALQIVLDYVASQAE